MATKKQIKKQITRAAKIEAYNEGHTQGEIVAKSGASADAHGPGKKWDDLVWEWHEGYADALNGIYDPHRMA